jgi:hypothetical protein
MVQSSRYYHMAMLTSTGQCQLKELPLAKDAFNHQLADDSTASTDKEVQLALWQQWQAGGQEAYLARLCLRCWVSGQIALVCRQLAQQFGSTYSFTAEDLWPLVLNDDGTLEPTYEPFSLKILASYDPNRGALSTWANNSTKDYSDINQFLLNQGLYRASDWAILNDTRVEQLPKILTGYRASELAYLSQLLNNYHRVYLADRRASMATMSRSAKRKCLPPTSEQLNRIDCTRSPSFVMTQLQDLANALRQYRISVRGGMLVTQSLDSDEDWQERYAAYEPREDEQTQDDFLQRYREDFEFTLKESIHQIAQTYAEKHRHINPPRDQIYLEALILLHCKRFSMKAIAQKLGLASQVQVTRLLVLNRFRSEIKVYWLRKLQNRVKDETLKHILPDRFDKIVQQLDDFLNSATQNVMQEAEAEMKTPQGSRQALSVFSKSLCETLSK